MTAHTPGTDDGSDYFDFEYDHTHESAHDGSPAMLVSQTAETITLVNEDGFQWTDPIEDWRPIPSGDPDAAGEGHTRTPVTLSADETNALYQAWLRNDVNKGIEWLTPVVEDIIEGRLTN